MMAAEAGEVRAERDQYIPARKADILDALIEHGALDERQRVQFRQLGRELAAIYHYNYFDQLEQLRADYFYFNPEREPHVRFDGAARERAYADLVETFDRVLAGANFVAIPHIEIERAHSERATLRVAIKTPLDDYRDVRFFHRGHHKETIEVADWFGLRKRKVEAIVYDDVVLFVAMKEREAIVSKRELKRLAAQKLRPGSVLIKYFRNIARTDLGGLFPNVRVVMSNFDKLVFGVPAIAGGVPIILNIASTLTVLFVVLGFYLGISGAVHESEVKKALAALSGLAALGAYLMQLWVKYQRQSLKYQKVLKDNVYFRNLNNNAGTFDHLIGAAEDQECKEAFLAYYFLHTAGASSTQDELERRIEIWLRETFGLDCDFDVDDALRKLDRLGLLVRDGDRLSVLALKDTLTQLKRVWGDLFSSANAK
jgi:hypothetical protein